MKTDTPADDLLSPFDDLPPAHGAVRIRTDKRRYGKTVTLIDGFDARTTDMRTLTTRLKRLTAAGGSHEGDTVVLQGDHATKVRDELERIGYQVTLTTT